MKVNDIIREGSMYDLYKTAKSITTQADAGTSDEYNKTITQFQQSLPAEEADELENLRGNYKLNPSYSNATAIGKFILNKGKYMQDRMLASKAAGEALAAVKSFEKSTDTRPDPSTIPAYLRKGKASPKTVPATSVGLDPGFQVVSSANPLVLRYKNSDFALTNDDKWVYMGSKKEVSPEMTQYLNKQLQKL
jgi:hypothetical protein